MHRAAPKGVRNAPRKCSCIGLRYSPRVNEDLYARPSNLWSSKKGPPSPAWMPNLNTREEESGCTLIRRAAYARFS